MLICYYQMSFCRFHFFHQTTTVIEQAVKIISGVTLQVTDINSCDVIGHAHAKWAVRLAQ